MKTLIRISGVLIVVIGLAGSFFSLSPLVYFINEDIAVNELSDFAMKMGDLKPRHKKQVVKGMAFILSTIYKNALLFVASWLSFLLALMIKFCGVEIMFLRELGRKIIIGVSAITIINGVICSMFVLQLLGMMNALIVVGSRDLEKYAFLSNMALTKVMFISLIWVILHALIIYCFTHPKVKRVFLG
ncbi:MAG: hypothetical protein NG712_01465 [Omnitrophica bacterium]|nr:hypothetical protein [Candidatus Omnitrophota bacterium]